MSDNNAMPKEIAEAIVAVMGKVGKLAKTEQNQHGRFKFAGIDAFIEACNPLMHEAGLIIVQSEEDFDIREARAGDAGKERITPWLVVRYSFTLIHKSGVTWQDRAIRTGFVMASNGPQAPGAAQSYALKNFMRSLFQIATGEAGEDADHHPHGQLPQNARQAAPQTRTAPKSPPKAPSAANGKAAAGEPATAGKPDWENGDSIPFGEPVDVDYVNTVGAIETVPLEIGIRKLRAAHKAPEDKLSNADWFTLYSNNKTWLEQHAPAVADELATRSG